MEAEAAIMAGIFFLGLFVHGYAATVFFATAEVFPAAVFVSIAAIAMTAGMVPGILFFLTVTAVAKKATQQTADQAQLGVNNATYQTADQTVSAFFVATMMIRTARVAIIIVSAVVTAPLGTPCKLVEKKESHFTCLVLVVELSKQQMPSV